MSRQVKQGFRADILKDARDLKINYYNRFETMGSISDYSCLLPRQMEQVSSALNEWWHASTFIIDGNAHIGCDTMHIATTLKRVEKIIAVEKDYATFQCLTKNMENRVVTMHGDICDLISKIGNTNADLYLDPPWGGPEYQKQETKNKLMLSQDTSVSSFISQAFQKKLVKSVILKAPINFDVEDLHRNLASLSSTIDVQKKSIFKERSNKKGNIYFDLYCIKIC